MNIQDQVVSLELAKKLLTLGVKQNSLFVWEYFSPMCYGIKFIPYAVLYNSYSTNEFKLYPAYTVAELGEILPKFVTLKDIDYYSYDLKYNRNGYPYYFASGINFKCEENETEANARAKMIIYLIENEFTL
jgi:hypothetical protein